MAAPNRVQKRTHSPHSQHPKKTDLAASNSLPSASSPWLHALISSDVLETGIFGIAYAREESPTPSRSPPEQQKSVLTTSLARLATGQAQSNRPLNSDFTLASSPPTQQQPTPPRPGPALRTQSSGEPTRARPASSTSLKSSFETVSSASKAESQSSESRKPGMASRKRRSSMLEGLDTENIIASQRRTRQRKFPLRFKS